MHRSIKSSIFILALGFGTLAVAQPPQAQTHKSDPIRETKRLSKELSLTPDQQSQIGLILADRQQRIAALSADTTSDPKSLRKQRKAIMMDTQQKISAILTPAQQQQLATLKSEHRHGKRGTQPPTAPPPAV